MTNMKTKIRNYRCTADLDELLLSAANTVECPPSRLLREFVREGAELILNDPKVANDLRRKYAVS
jgi:hypothetical protein